MSPFFSVEIPCPAPVPKFDRSDADIWRYRFVPEYTFRGKISYEVVDETIFLSFVELNRFDKRLDDCVDMADKWFYSLKHIGSMEDLPEDEIRKL